MILSGFLPEHALLVCIGIGEQKEYGMRCLRCGQCCKTMLVPIVDDPEIGFDPMGDGSNIICHEGNGPCKHLRGDKPGEYYCSIHEKKWYKHTPCYAFGQIEKSKTDECRLGKWHLRNAK